jgi:hypothetical protein
VGSVPEKLRLEVELTAGAGLALTGTETPEQAFNRKRQETIAIRAARLKKLEPQKIVR